MAGVTLDLDGTPAAEPARIDRVPRRLQLSREAVEHLAGLTSTPLPWDAAPQPSRTARILGAPNPADPPAAGDPERELREVRVLHGSGDVHPEVAEAMTVFGTPEVLVDLDLSVRRAQAPAGFAQVHSWQRLRGGRVTTLATTGGHLLEVGWFDDDLWQRDLARSVTVTPPLSRTRPPQHVVDLPHELLLGSGEALRLHRDDVFAELAARHTGSVFTDDSTTPLGRAGTDEQVRLLHTSVVGRMRTVVAGVGSTGSRKVGWVSWLLFADGWRALTPYTRDHQARVRIHPVGRLRLGVDVARLVTQVKA